MGKGKKYTEKEEKLVKLFEIDNKIKEVLDEITIDPDTGLLVESYRVDETTGETVDLNSELENLILQRDEKE